MSAPTRITYRGWVLDADVDATRAAYASEPTGDAEKCGCSYCVNFAAARDRVYPEEVRELFARLGVDFRKEGEAAQTHRSDDGLHHYMGWIHFIGSVVSGPAEADLAEITPTFSLGLSNKGSGPRLESFRGRPVVEVYFDASIPWACDRPEWREPESGDAR